MAQSRGPIGRGRALSPHTRKEQTQRYRVLVRAEGYLPATGESPLVGDEPLPLEVGIMPQRE